MPDLDQPLSKTIFLITLILFPFSSSVALEKLKQKSFYVMDGDCCGGEESDPHAVHGIETESGAFILTGKIIDESGMEDGFIVKVPNSLPDEKIFLHEDEDFNIDWSLKIGSENKRDGLNSTALLTDAIFAGGYLENQRGIIERHLIKLNERTGALIWAQSYPSKNNKRESAIESITPSLNNGLIIAGVKNSEEGTIEGFKSYGNPATGDAFVMYFSEEKISSEVAPDGPTWEIDIPDTLSGKHIVEAPDNDGYILAAHSDGETAEAKIVKISSMGELEWTLDVPSHGEVTAIAATNKGYFISGHKFDQFDGIDASISKISLGGKFIWNKTYGNPSGGETIFAGLDGGNPKFIYDECWGITQFQNGLVVACGTGIEDCEELSVKNQSDCESDPRSIWRSYLLNIDFSGNLIWERATSFTFDDEEDDDVPSTASEWVFTNANGSIVSVVDLSFGFGLEVLQ